MSQWPVRGIGTSPRVRTSSRYGTFDASALVSAAGRSSGSSTRAAFDPERLREQQEVGIVRLAVRRPELGSVGCC